MSYPTEQKPDEADRKAINVFLNNFQAASKVINISNLYTDKFNIS